LALAASAAGLPVATAFAATDPLLAMNRTGNVFKIMKFHVNSLSVRLVSPIGDRDSDFRKEDY
jgi:hypothetical protein